MPHRQGKHRVSDDQSRRIASLLIRLRELGLTTDFVLGNDRLFPPDNFKREYLEALMAEQRDCLIALKSMRGSYIRLPYGQQPRRGMEPPPITRIAG